MRWLGIPLVLVLTACGSSTDDTRASDEPGVGGTEAGPAGTGGAQGTGGKASTGGTTGAGGTANTGGTTGSGGTTGTGGTTGSGGTTGTGGTTWHSDAGAGCPGAPALTPGVWKSITPAALDYTGTYGSAHIEIDPNNPCTLYAAADQRGLWKTTDAGSTWTRLGTPPATSATTTTYLDSPILVRIEPGNPKHMYATQGVRGTSMGFFESIDGGSTWTMPAGFVAIATTIGTRDMTQMSVDPTDFKHVIVGSHSAWKSMTNAGVLETKDGGATFIAHQPVASWVAGSIGLHFLFDPDLSIGNKDTWLVATDGDGFWRTTDGATSWTQVEDHTLGCPHGGNSIYYTAAGVLYAGGYQYPVRSTDNGGSWTQVKTGLAYAYYYTVQGDGTNLYTLKSFADNTAKYNAPYQTSLETDGLTWTPYQGGAQNFDNGPFTMHFDKVNRIMYSANWDAGLWALAVLP
jgi:hypothetical protein